MQTNINRNNINEKKNNCAVIIYGSRFGPSMKTFGPKFLYKDYYGKPIIETQIRVVKEVLPNAEIILVTGYLSERITRYKQENVRIVENQLFLTHNDTEDIRLALNNTSKENIITISADMIFNKYTLQNIMSEPLLVYDSKHQLHDSEIGVTMTNNEIININFDIINKWCHIGFFEKKHLTQLTYLCSRENKSQYLFEIINIMLDNGYKFKAYEPNNMKIHKIDTSKKIRNYKI